LLKAIAESPTGFPLERHELRNIRCVCSALAQLANTSDSKRATTRL
jgi:AMMECR1 domain-containing protein